MSAPILVTILAASEDKAGCFDEDQCGHASKNCRIGNRKSSGEAGTRQTSTSRRSEAAAATSASVRDLQVCSVTPSVARLGASQKVDLCRATQHSSTEGFCSSEPWRKSMCPAEPFCTGGQDFETVEMLAFCMILTDQWALRKAGILEVGPLGQLLWAGLVSNTPGAQLRGHE